MAEYTTLPAARARAFCEALFAGYGLSDADAREAARVIIGADLCGIESHGVQRLIRYDEEISSGAVDPRARIETLAETPLSAALDARRAMGQTAARYAMDMAIAKARAGGVGMVTVRDSNHFGIASYYTGLAVEADLIGVCMTNTEAICVPTFGKKAMLGTNPLAVAMPASPYPFSFDAATTVVPRGKLEVYEKNGLPLPAGWALDAGGRVERDAAAALRTIIGKRGGGIAPLGGAGRAGGGHKGYGLAAVVELCCGILSGGLTSNRVGVEPDRTGICHFFAAIDYGMFGEKTAIRAALSRFLAELRETPAAEGQSRVYTPGERRAETMARRLKEGIPVHERTLACLRDLAARRGIAPPDAPAA